MPDDQTLEEIGIAMLEADKVTNQPSIDTCSEGWDRHNWQTSHTFTHHGERYTIYGCAYCPAKIVNFA